MIHTLKSFIQTDSNVIDQIKGKFKDQIILSIAMDDVQYEDEYINQLELIKPYLSEISFLELLIQKNQMIPFKSTNKIAKYLECSFFSELQDPQIKRVVFKDIYHSAHGWATNIDDKLQDMNYKEYIVWVFNFISTLKSIGELDLNINSKFLNQQNTSVFNNCNINKLQIYIEKNTNISNIVQNLQQNTLRCLRVNIKENTIIPKEMFNVLYQLFTYLEAKQSIQIKEIILYNVFDDMIAKPNISNSFLSSSQSKAFNLLGIKKEQLNQQQPNSRINDLNNNEKNIDEIDENSIKQQMTIKFIESIQIFKNLQKLSINSYILDLLCLETIKNTLSKSKINDKSDLTYNQSFQDIPLSHSHKSSQIIDWNKQVSSQGSQTLIKSNNLEESKFVINEQNTPEKIPTNNYSTNNDTPNKSIQHMKKQKSVFKSHALEGIVFQYSSKLETSKQIEKQIKNSNSSSQEIIQKQYEQENKRNSILEQVDTQSSSNDSSKKRTCKNLDRNNESVKNQLNSSNTLIQTNQNKEQPSFILFSEKQQESAKKYDIDDIPFFSIDSGDELDNPIYNQPSKPEKCEDNQQQTPVFADIYPEEVIRQNIQEKSSTQSDVSQNESNQNQVKNEQGQLLKSIDLETQKNTFKEKKPTQNSNDHEEIISAEQENKKDEIIEKSEEYERNKQEQTQLQLRKTSQTLHHQSSKESGFYIDSSQPHIDISDDCSSNTQQTQQNKMQPSLSMSNQLLNQKLVQEDTTEQQQLSLTLKINHYNRNIGKHLIEFFSTRLKEILIQINEYEDSSWQEYIQQEQFSIKKLVIQWTYKLMRTPPLKMVEASNLFNFLREKQNTVQNLTLQLTNKKQFCPTTCQSLQDYISNHSALKTFNFETCMFPSQMEFYKFLVCIAKSTIRHIEIQGPKFEVLSDETNLISPWKTYLSNRLRSLTIIGQNYSLNVLSNFSKWKMFHFGIVHLSSTPTLPRNLQLAIIQNQYLFSFSHKNLQPNNVAHQCYDKVHAIIVQYKVFSKQFYSILTYSPEITFWDLFFN